jgi:hypothetical protein
VAREQARQDIRDIALDRLLEVQERYVSELARYLEGLTQQPPDKDPERELERQQAIGRQYTAAERLDRLLNGPELDPERLAAHMMYLDSRAGYDTPVRLVAEAREQGPPAIMLEIDLGRDLEPVRVPFNCREQVVAATLGQMNQGRLPRAVGVIRSGR